MWERPRRLTMRSPSQCPMTSRSSTSAHAKANPEGKDGREKLAYVPKTVDLDDLELTLPDGNTESVPLAADDGWLSWKDVKESGEPRPGDGGGRWWTSSATPAGEHDHSRPVPGERDRKSTRLNSSHVKISY